ncbi:MAG: VCBS domain-containing protein [Pseudomonadota bacterium]|nr:VCBS domain-containing protein [Pseudomonadota bacterium]
MAIINGTSNADQLFGSPQNDTLNGSIDIDVMRGGAGDDIYIVDHASDVVDETNFVISNTTSVTQVDLGAATAHRAIDLGDISPDGTKIVFASNARLAGTDLSDSGNDLYVKDLISGTITHVNVRSNGTQATPLTSTYRAMFLDNNRVAFSSTDASMIAGVTDTNSTFDIFIKNLTTGELTLVTNTASSSTTTGSSASALASVSLDGSKILFTSLATNLGPTDTNGFQDLYMKDVNTGEVTLVSQLSTGVQADNESTRTGFTGRVLARFVGSDNTKVLFSSKATNFVTPDNNNTGANTGNILGNDLFIKDLVTGDITRVNTGSAGQQGNYNIRIGDVSNDGTKVLFVTQASNLIDPSNSTLNPIPQLYVKDLITGTVTLISTPNGTTLADQESYNPIFTADGTRVIFRTAATNLGAGSTAGSDTLMYDLNTNQLIQLNTTSAGVASDGNTPNSSSLRSVLSPDGSRIYFIDQGNNLSGTSDAFLDIFYRDLFQVTSGDAGGIDTVQSSIDYTLGSYIENLTLNGSDHINGTGNDLDNVIVGNTGNNVITGGLGVDMLTGNGGNDTFVFGNISHSSNATPDVITDFTQVADQIDLTGIAGAPVMFNGTVARANSVWYTQNAGNTDVMIDTTGDAVADSTIRLTGTLNLTAADFIGVAVNAAPVASPLSVSGTEDDVSIAGQVVANDADGDTLTYAVDGATPAGLTFNSDGSFSYVPTAVDQALAAGESRQVVFDFIANDGTVNSTAQTVTITVNGVNDVAVISGDVVGEVGEQRNLNAAPVQVLGQLTLTDLDSSDQSAGFSVASGSSASAYGSYSINALGEWQYTLDLNHADVQQLSAEDQLADSFDVASSDGTVQRIDITIIGSDFYHGDTSDNVFLGGRGHDEAAGFAGADELYGGQGGDLLLGHGGNDQLYGGEGHDVLDGGLGQDQMFGGVGDDRYIVNTAGDMVVELADEGVDHVLSSIDYQLSDHIEHLTLTEVGLTGIGNLFGNTMIAHQSGSSLFGRGGDDHLIGDVGNDILDGGLGQDVMVGGQGNDTYFVNTRGDSVVESDTEGYDTINSTINWDMEDHVEQLNLLGSANIYGRGNSRDNLIMGNSGDNLLNGGLGANQLIGGTGHDTYVLRREYGLNVVEESADSSGGLDDHVALGVGVSANQVWFSQVDDDLQVSIIGTEARVLIQDWYSEGISVERFRLHNGSELSANDVEALVNAMSAFEPPALGETSLNTEQQNALGGLIATSWAS